MFLVSELGGLFCFLFSKEIVPECYMTAQREIITVTDRNYAEMPVGLAYVCIHHIHDCMEMKLPSCRQTAVDGSRYIVEIIWFV